MNKANTKEVLNLFTGLHEKGQTILLVTHDKEAALRGNRILYIEDGRVISELALPEYGKISSDAAYRGHDSQERSDGRKNLYTNDDREKKLAAWLEGLGW